MSHLSGGLPESLADAPGRHPGLCGSPGCVHSLPKPTFDLCISGREVARKYQEGSYDMLGGPELGCRVSMTSPEPLKDGMIWAFLDADEATAVVPRWGERC